MNIIHKKLGVTFVELILSVFILSTVLTIFLQTFTIISVRSSSAAHYNKALVLAQESFVLLEKDLQEGKGLNICNNNSLFRKSFDDGFFIQEIFCYKLKDDTIAELRISWDFQGNQNILPIKFVL